MTLQRSERSAEDLLYALASSYPGGVEAMAGRLGMSARVLYKKLSASVADRATTTKEFSSIIHKAEDAGMSTAHDPLQALCFRHGGIFLPIANFDHTSDEDILKQFAIVMTHLGSLAGEFAGGELEDGAMTERDMERIEPRARNSFAVMAALWARIKGRLKRDSDKPRRSIFRKPVDDSTTTSAVQ